MTHSIRAIGPSVRVSPRRRARASKRRLESDSKVYAGLQSLRNMRRMEARRRNMRAVKLRVSQSLANLRQRLNQAIDSLDERALPNDEDAWRTARAPPLRAAEVRSGSDLDGAVRPTSRYYWATSHGELGT